MYLARTHTGISDKHPYYVINITGATFNIVYVEWNKPILKLAYQGTYWINEYVGKGKIYSPKVNQ